MILLYLDIQDEIKECIMAVPPLRPFQKKKKKSVLTVRISRHGKLGFQITNTLTNFQ